MSCAFCSCLRQPFVLSLTRYYIDIWIQHKNVGVIFVTVTFNFFQLKQFNIFTGCIIRDKYLPCDQY